MWCLNVSQNVTRKTFKITRKHPPNNPQTHQESGSSDAAERLNRVTFCCLVVVCGSAPATPEWGIPFQRNRYDEHDRTFSRKRCDLHHRNGDSATRRFSPFRIWRVSFSTSINGGFRNNQLVTPYQQKSTSTVTEIVMVAGGLRHHHGDDAVNVRIT